MITWTRVRNKRMIISKRKQYRMENEMKVTIGIMVAGIALILIGISGCGTLGTGQNLSAEQMKAMQSDKNANAFCGVASGPWGKVITTYVVVDQKVIQEGGFSVDESCKVMFNNAAPAVVVNNTNPVVTNNPVVQPSSAPIPTVSPASITPRIR
jgi:hypothetical protein